MSGKVSDSKLVFETCLEMDKKIVFKTFLKSSVIRQLVELWPLFAGLGVAFLVILITTIVMVKTGLTKKARYYKAETDKVLECEKRRTLMMSSGFGESEMKPKLTEMDD